MSTSRHSASQLAILLRNNSADAKVWTRNPCAEALETLQHAWVVFNDSNGTLPGIRDRLAFGIIGAAPAVLAITSAPRRELPLRFGRQAAAKPLRIGESVFVSD